jgi:hypothetical protein
VHADYLLGPGSTCSDFRDGNRGSVAGQNTCFGAKKIKLLKNFSLNVKVFGGCFNDQIGILGTFLNIGKGFNPF